MDANRDHFPVAVMCHVLNVSRAGFYEWQARPLSARQVEDERLGQRVAECFWQGRGCYGTRRLKRALAQNGLVVSRRRIARLLKEQGLVCKTRKKHKPCTSGSHPEHAVVPNRLDRHFSVAAPNQCYVGDITYIDTDQGWLYLAVWVDLYSRAVVGWSMQAHMKSSLVCDALRMALSARSTAPGLMIHSDRGSQYTSDAFQHLLHDHQFVASMSRKAQCWDNAVAESFFHTLKTEQVFHQHYATREEAKQAIFEYIEVFYNRQRLHSSNDYLSPEAFEQQFLAV